MATDGFLREKGADKKDRLGERLPVPEFRPEGWVELLGLDRLTPRDSLCAAAPGTEASRGDGSPPDADEFCSPCVPTAKIFASGYRTTEERVRVVTAAAKT